MSDASSTTSTELDSVIDHLNVEHADSMLLIARFLGDRLDLVEAQLVGEAAGRLEMAGRTDRVADAIEQTIFIPYAGTPGSLDEFREELLSMLASARELAGEDVPLTSIERELAGIGDLSTFVTHVVARRALTPHLVEVTVGGGLDAFESLGGDQHLYVLLPPPGRSDLTIGTDFTWSAFDEMDDVDRPVGAYYTVRRWRPEAGEIDLWFVLHGHADDAVERGDGVNEGGHVSRWAARVQPGDQLALWGPKASFHPPDSTNAFLLVGDETGLAAIAAIVDELLATDRNVAIDVIVEVTDAEHTVEFVDHPSVTVTWLLRDGNPPGIGEALLEAVRQFVPTAAVDTRSTYAFGAGESRQISAVRRYLRADCSLEPTQVSMTGYWRRS